MYNINCFSNPYDCPDSKLHYCASINKDWTNLVSWDHRQMWTWRPWHSLCKTKFATNWTNWGWFRSLLWACHSKLPIQRLINSLRAKEWRFTKMCLAMSSNAGISNTRGSFVRLKLPRIWRPDIHLDFRTTAAILHNSIPTICVWRQHCGQIRFAWNCTESIKV